MTAHLGQVGFYIIYGVLLNTSKVSNKWTGSQTAYPVVVQSRNVILKSFHFFFVRRALLYLPEEKKLKRISNIYKTFKTLLLGLPCVGLTVTHNKSS